METILLVILSCSLKIDPLAIHYDVLQRRSDGVIVLVGTSTPALGQNSTESQAILSAQAINANATDLMIDQNKLQWKNGEQPISSILIFPL